MLHRLKRLYTTVETLGKLIVLFVWWGARRLIWSFRLPIPYRSPRDVVIVQFAPRPGVVGGDSVVNGYIREILLQAGVSVETVHLPQVKSRMGFTRWLFGDRWAQTQALKRQLQGRDCTVLIDSQLSLGAFSQPTICICHYSFWGYTQLATERVDSLGRLFSLRDSLVQAFGTIGTRVIAVSQFQAGFLKKEWVKVERIIPNVQLGTTDAQPFNRKGFVFLGGYSRYGKGFDVLEGLAACGWEIDCYTNYDGPGPLRYHPFIPHEEVPKVLGNYAILLHPSRYESCSMAVLEALSCGLPVLISNVGIGPDLKKVIPEFVVSRSGPEGLADYQEKAKTILGHYQHYSSLAQQYAVRYHSLAQFESAWKEVFHLETPRP